MMNMLATDGWFYEFCDPFLAVLSWVCAKVIWCFHCLIIIYKLTQGGQDYVQGEL